MSAAVGTDFESLDVFKLQEALLGIKLMIPVETLCSNY